MWSEGTIGIPDAKDKEKHTICHYWVKHYEEPNEEYGINGGRISKLTIKINGKVTDQLRQRLGHRAGGRAHAAGLHDPPAELQLNPEYEYSGRQEPLGSFSRTDIDV